MKKSALFLIMAFCAILAVVSCDRYKDNSERILGIWNSSSITLYMNEGPSVSIDMAGELEFTFVFSATTVTTIGGGESETVSYVLDGDCIYMEGGTVTSEIVELTNDTLKLKFVVDGEGYVVMTFKRG